MLMEVNVKFDNETYLVKEFIYQNDLTLSTTTLYVNKETRGHEHDNPEIYYIVSGSGILEMRKNGESSYLVVKTGDVIDIPPNVFHKVYNDTKNSLVFVCAYNKNGGQ